MGGARLPKGNKDTKKQVFYADPDRPGSSRHGTCFPKGRSAKREQLERTDGPCWVCNAGATEFITYKSVSSYLDDLCDVCVALRAVCDTGFELAKVIRCNCWDAEIPRAEIETQCVDLVQQFRREWQSAGKIAHFHHKRSGDVTEEGCILMASIAYGLVDVVMDHRGLMSALDPRGYFRGGDPSMHDRVQAAQLEGRLGRLGFIANQIWLRVAVFRDAMVTNHGKDAEQTLVKVISALGASSPLLARAALTKTWGNGPMVERRAETLAGMLRQRKFSQDQAEAGLSPSEDE